MDERDRNIRIRVDGYTRVCLTVIAALLTVLIVGLWADGVPSARDAMGMKSGIPDSGQQRDRMIKALERNTAQLDQLIRLFESGTAKVQVVADAGAKRETKPKKK